MSWITWKVEKACRLAYIKVLNGDMFKSVVAHCLVVLSTHH